MRRESMIGLVGSGGASCDFLSIVMRMTGTLQHCGFADESV
jgi:hypothetical protein